MTEPSPLGVAIALWKQGRPPPVDIVTALIDQGFDVAALERFYRKQISPAHR